MEQSEASILRELLRKSQADCAELRQQLEVVEAREAALREWAEAAGHVDSCEAAVTPSWGPCNCGLDAALSSSPPSGWVRCKCNCHNRDLVAEGLVTPHANCDTDCMEDLEQEQARYEDELIRQAQRGWLSPEVAQRVLTLLKLGMYGAKDPSAEEPRVCKGCLRPESSGTHFAECPWGSTVALLEVRGAP